MKHKDALEKNKNALYAYSFLDNIDMRPIIDCSQLKVNKTFTIEDIESMELALITLYQLIGNLAGRTTEFKYKGYL